MRTRKTVQQIAELFGVPRSTVYGHLNRDITARQPKKAPATKTWSWCLAGSPPSLETHSFGDLSHPHFESLHDRLHGTGSVLRRTDLTRTAGRGCVSGRLTATMGHRFRQGFTGPVSTFMISQGRIWHIDTTPVIARFRC